MKVSVVIPNWNGKKLLEKNLDFVLAAASYKKNEIAEVIVVDDKSSDDSVAFLEKNYSNKVKIIRHRENRGFCSAVNTGVRTANYKLVCLLNVDVVVSKNFLVSIQNYFKKRDVFAVSLHEEGYGPAVGRFEKGFFEHMGMEEVKEVFPSFWASGGSGVFRRDIWMELRGFDEELMSPFYWEDVDICYRAMKRGYKILWDPRAKVIHQHESVINPNNFNKKWLELIKERNQLLFIWKNITSPIFFRRHLNGLLERVFRHPGYIVVILYALVKIRAVLNLRKKERKETQISDEAIFASFDE